MQFQQHEVTDLHAHQAEVQRCLAMLIQDLATRYEDDQSVPPAAVATRRFTARKIGGLPCFITLRHYDQPLTPQALEAQRVLLHRFSTQESGSLCALVESRLEPHAHYVVSTLGGAISLRQLLRQKRRLEFALVSQLLERVVEALEEAAAKGWPKAMIDAHALFVDATDPLHGPLKLVVPPLPAPQQGFPPVPREEEDYMRDLALLTCELLGMPARGQRFRPLPQLRAEVNETLRDIIEGSENAGQNSVRQFVDSLAVTTGRVHPTGTTLRPTTGSHAAHPKAEASPVRAEQMTATAIVAPPVPQRPLQPVTWPEKPSESLAGHLRLQHSANPASPIIALHTGSELRIGRSARAHHVAQFAPRNPRNDERTRLLSREHLSLHSAASAFWAEPSASGNLCFVGGKPITGRHDLGRHCRVTVAGEYDLDIRRLDSAWAPEGPWQDKPAPTSGALLLSPGRSSSALPFQTLWLLSDAAFGVTPAGLNTQPSSRRDVLGWFLVAHDGIWVLAAAEDGSVAVDGRSVSDTTPVPLQPGSRFLAAGQEWTVNSLPAG